MEQESMGTYEELDRRLDDLRMEGSDSYGRLLADVMMHLADVNAAFDEGIPGLMHHFDNDMNILEAGFERVSFMVTDSDEFVEHTECVYSGHGRFIRVFRAHDEWESEEVISISFQSVKPVTRTIIDYEAL